MVNLLFENKDDISVVSSRATFEENVGIYRSNKTPLAFRERDSNDLLSKLISTKK